MTTETVENETGIAIDNIRSIDHVFIPLPPGGGVTELAGESGVGKSTALQCAAEVVGGKGGNHNLSPRRDSSVDPKGTIAFGDVLVTVRQSTRHKGTAAVVNLEGKLDLAAFVEPGIIDQEKNDERRIRALVKLTGVEADLRKFDHLLDAEKLEEITSTGTAKAHDMVTMSSSLKRDLQAEARKCKETGLKAEGKATMLQASIDGLDLDGECDEQTLNDAHREAVREMDRLADQLVAAGKARTSHETATRQLAELARSYDGPTVEEAGDDHAQAVGKVTELKEQLADLQQQLTAAESAEFIAESGKQSAIEHFEMIAGCKQIIADNAPTETTSDADVAAAKDRVEQASAAMLAGVETRRGIESRDRAAHWRKQSEDARKQATQLLEAAKGTDEVLAEAIACDALRVQEGRLVTTHPQTGVNVFFAELSDGQKWKLAIDLAVATLNRNDVPDELRVLVIAQSAWEGLNPEKRKVVHNHSIERNVNIVTAIAEDGPLVARTYKAAA